MDMEIKPLINSYDLHKRIIEIAKDIDRDFKEDIYILGILNGAFMFVSDLVKHIKNKVYIDFVKASSYENKEFSEFKLICDIKLDIKDKAVILVDDILDTGKTLQKIIDVVLSKNPKTLKICTLLDKPSRRIVDIKADYIGFCIEDRFVVGYGLDYNGFGRNLDFIAMID